MVKAMRKAVYPGSFDPVTTGHVNIIERAAMLYDELTVCIMDNKAKKGLLKVSQRIELLETALMGIPNVRLDVWSGLLTDYLKENEMRVVIKGVRDSVDFQYETVMAQINNKLLPECETLFMLSDPRYAVVSSSAVRELLAFHAELGDFVPKNTVEPLLKMLGNTQS